LPSDAGTVSGAALPETDSRPAFLLVAAAGSLAESSNRASSGLFASPSLSSRPSTRFGLGVAGICSPEPKLAGLTAPAAEPPSGPVASIHRRTDPVVEADVSIGVFPTFSNETDSVLVSIPVFLAGGAAIPDAGPSVPASAMPEVPARAARTASCDCQLERKLSAPGREDEKTLAVAAPNQPELCVLLYPPART